jgi:hypothetical protein
MPQYISLPSGNSLELREGETPQQAWARGMQEYPQEFGMGVEAEKKSTAKSGFMPALKAGIEGLKGDVAALAGRSGIMDLDAAEQYRAEKQAKAASIFKPTTDNWIESPLTKIGELAGGSVPYMAAPLAAGVAATAAAPAIGLGALGATALGAGAAGLTSAGQFTASNLSRQVEEGKKLGETDLGAAALAAVPQAALDMVGLKMIPGIRGMIFKGTGQKLTTEAAQNLAQQSLKQVAADYAKATGKTMTAEGLTEAGQQVFERLQAGLSIDDAQARQEYFDNFIGGAVLGGALAPAGRMVERGRIKGEQATAAAAEEQKQRDAAAAAQEQAAAERRAAPGYIPDLLKQSEEYAKRIADLRAASKAPADADPVAQAMAKRAGEELNDLQRSDEYQAHVAAVQEAAPDIQALQQKQAQEQAAKDKAAADEAEARRTDPVLQAKLYGEADTIGGQLADLRNKADAAIRAGDHDAFTELTAQADALATRQKELKAQLGQRPSKQLEQIAELRAELQRLEGTTTAKGVAKPGAIMKLWDSGDRTGSAALAQKARDIRQQLSEFEANARTLEQRTAEAEQQTVSPAPVNPMATFMEDSDTIEGMRREGLTDAEIAAMERKRMPTTFTEQRELPLKANPVQYTSAATVQRREQTRADLVQQFQDLVRSARTQRVQGRVPRELQERITQAADQIRDFDSAVARQGMPRGQATAEAAEALAGTQRPEQLPARQNVENVKRVYTPATASETAVEEQLARLPAKLAPQDEALVQQITREWPALRTATMEEDTSRERDDRVAGPRQQGAMATTPVRALDDVAEYLYRLSTGNDATAQAAQVQKHLARLEQGKRSETQTPTRETAWGTATKPTETAIQEDMFPDTETQGTIFNSYAEFEDYLAGDAVKEARAAVGKTLATAARLQREIAPMEAEVARLRQQIESMQNAYKWVVSAGDKSVAAAQAEHTAALANLRKVRDRLGTDLETARIRLIEAQLELSKAVEKQAAISDAIAKNTAKFNRDEGVQAAASKVAEAQAAHAAAMRSEAQTGVYSYETMRRLYDDVVSSINAHRSLLEANQRDSQKLQERSILAFLNRDMELMLRLRDAAQTVEKARANLNNARQVLEAAATETRTEVSPSPETRAELADATKRVSTAQGILTKARNRAATGRAELVGDIQQATDTAQELEWRINTMLPAAAASAKVRNPDIQAARNRISTLKSQIAQHNEEIYARMERKEQPTAAQNTQSRTLAEALAQEEAKLRVLMEAPRVGAKAAARALAARTEETQTDREARDAAIRKEEQERAERLAAIPGVQVTHENVKKTLDEAERIPERLRVLDAAAKDETASKAARNKAKYAAVDMRERAKVLYGLISNNPEFSQAAVEELDKRIAKTDEKVKAKQIAVNEPGKAASTIRSRRKELSELGTELRELKRLRKMAGNRATFTPIGVSSQTTRQLGDRLEALQNTQRTVEGEERKAGLQKQIDAVQAELDRRDEAEQRLTLERGINIETLGTTGKLPERKIGPVVKKAVQAGNVRTGDTTTTEQRTVGTRNKVQQAGKVRGVTGTQAVRQAAKDVSYEQALLRLSEIEDLKERNDAALAKARADKNAAGIAKYEGFATRLKKGIEVAQKQVSATAEGAFDAAGIDEDVAPSQFRTQRDNTPVSSDIAEAVNDGRIMDVVRGLAAEGSTPEVRARAEALVPLLLRTKIKVDPDVQFRGESVAGLYSPTENTITMHPDALTEEDLLHEMTHAATDRTLLAPDADLTADQRSAKNELENMRRMLTARDEFGDQDIDNVREFAAEVASNPYLRERMDRIGAPRSLWQRFKDAVSRLLGWSTPQDPLSKKATALVDRIMQPSRRVAPAATTSAAPSMFRKPAYETSSALGKMSDMITTKPTSPLKRLGQNAGLSIEMWGVDMRAPLMKALSVAGEKTLNQATYYVRKADALMNHVYASLSDGPLQLVKTSKGNFEIKAGNGPSMKVLLDAVRDIKGISPEDKMGKLQAYMAAQRAERVGWDKLNFANATELQTQATAMKAELAADPQQKAALENARKVYNDINKGTVNFLAASGYISKAKAAELLQYGDYVPFYRVQPNGAAELVMGETAVIHVGDLRKNKFLAPLVGDDQKLLPLNESLVRNTMLLTDMALKNLAAKDVAYGLQKIGAGAGEKGRSAMPIHKGKPPAGADVVTFRQEPDPNDAEDTGERWLRVRTQGTAVEHIPAEMLVQSLEGSFATLPAGLKAAAWFGDILRSGVTRNPMYIARQLIRDPLAATFTGGLDAGITKSVFKTLSNYVEQTRGRSEAGQELLRKGLVQSGIFTGDIDDINKMMLQLTKGDQGAFKKTLAWWDKAAMSADAATRIQMYKDARAKGMDEMEAELAAMEMMNFNKRGLSPTVQYAARLVPFLNAQIQGLNVLFKAMTGNMPQNEKLAIKEKFYRRALTMALFTVGYAMAMEDDDTYKNARPRDRYNNWILPNPLGGEHIRIPIPFEVGVLFKALPEAVVDVMRGDFNEQEFKAIRQAFVGQIPGASSYGLPQAIKPVIEVVTNHSFLTDREIETKADLGKTSTERFGAGTTEVAKEASKIFNAVGLELSPKQLDHLVSGYLGSLPVMVARLTNGVFAGTEGVTRPTERASDSPIYGALFQKEFGGGPVDAAYAHEAALSQAKRTYDSMVADGRKADAEAYKEDVLNVLGSPELAKRFKSKIDLLQKADKAARKQIKDPDALRERLNELERQKNEVAKTYLAAVEQIAR